MTQFIKTTAADSTGNPIHSVDAIAIPYHNMYLQKGGTQFEKPILFEDGMDFEECELYYMTMEAQRNGGVIRSSSMRSANFLTKNTKNSDLSWVPSILRKNKERIRPDARIEKAFPRRNSFSGIAPIRCSDAGSLRRSTSKRDIRACSHVVFDEKVKVVTIDPISDIPREIRAKLWLSRVEMMNCINDAMKAKEEARIHRQKQVEDQIIELEQRLGVNLNFERRGSSDGSVDSVVTECIASCEQEQSLKCY